MQDNNLQTFVQQKTSINDWEEIVIIYMACQERLKPYIAKKTEKSKLIVTLIRNTRAQVI